MQNKPSGVPATQSFSCPLSCKISAALTASYLTISMASAQTIPFEINTENIQELEESTVIATASKRPWLKSPGSSITMRMNDFIEQGGSDLGNIARYDPTVSAPFNLASSDGSFGYGQTGYTGYNIRGIEGNRVLMLVDGIRQPEQFISTTFAQDEGSAGGAGRDYYDPAMFEATEILKGSASALYGSDAMAGVVSYRTPDAEDFLGRSDRNFGGLLRAQYFSHNESFAQQGFFATEKDQFSFLLGVATRQGSETKNNGSIAPNPADQDSQSYLMKMRWTPNDANSFGFTLENFNRERFIDVVNVTPGMFDTFNKFIHNDERQTRERYSLDWQFQPVNTAGLAFDTVDTMLYYQATNNESINNSESIFGRIRNQHIEFNTDIIGLRSTFRKQIYRNDLTYGIDISKATSENSFFRTDNGLPPFPNNISFAPTDTLRAAAFLQTEFIPSAASRWSFIAGARIDYNEIEPNLSADYLDRIRRLSGGFNSYETPGKLDNLTIAPRLDALYALTDHSTLYAKYSQGFRNPTAEELSMIFDHPPSGGSPAGNLTLPNPELEEESSHAFEIGYKYLDQTMQLQATSFYTRYSDFIEYGVRTGNQNSEGRDIYTTVNRGKATIYGYELKGAFQMDDWHTRLSGFEIGASTGQTWGVDNQDDTWLNSVEPMTSIAWLGYVSDDNKLGARISGTYVAEVKHVSDDDGGPYFRPPSYFTLDVSAYYKINDDITIQAGVNNLLDRKYYSWANTRRSGGHSANQFAIDDRSTAPGMNGFVSLTYEF